MNRFFILFFLALFALPKAQAERDSVQGVYLGLQGGLGYGLYRDLGASPLTYRGLELTPGLNVRVDQPKWRFQAGLGVRGGGYGYSLGISNMQSFGGQFTLGFSALRKTAQHGPWQLWGGVSLDNRTDFRYSSAMGNADVGIANFVNLNLIGRIELSLRHWVLHAQLALTPVSLLLRPGYAYMDNFDSDISSPTANLLDQYRWYLAGATIIASDLGATFVLPNGNRIGLSYCWHYMTSRATSDNLSAPFCFEQAGHALLFELGFKL